MQYEIFVGSKKTMESIAAKGAKALNPKTMKFQTIDQEAKYEVIEDGIGAILTSDKDLRNIAKSKGLFI